jgi:uncharacterized protein (DUF3084 family)
MEEKQQVVLDKLFNENHTLAEENARLKEEKQSVLNLYALVQKEKEEVMQAHQKVSTARTTLEKENQNLRNEIQSLTERLEVRATEANEAVQETIRLKEELKQLKKG